MTKSVGSKMVIFSAFFGVVFSVLGATRRELPYPIIVPMCSYSQSNEENGLWTPYLGSYLSLGYNNIAHKLGTGALQLRKDGIVVYYSPEGKGIELGYAEVISYGFFRGRSHVSSWWRFKDPKFPGRRCAEFVLTLNPAAEVITSSYALPDSCGFPIANCKSHPVTVFTLRIKTGEQVVESSCPTVSDSSGHGNSD